MKATPKPIVPVQCHNCNSLKKKPLLTKDANLDFYWRYYRCKDCKKTYWCGVRHSDSITVFTTRTPHLTRINSYDMMTGNLRSILPEGHEAVTADYNQFLPNGKLPKEILYANLDAEEAEAKRRNPDPEPLNVSMAKHDAEASSRCLPATDSRLEATTPSNEEPTEYEIIQEFNAFKRWLAVNIDKLKAAGYTDSQEQMVFNKWAHAHRTGRNPHEKGFLK